MPVIDAKQAPTEDWIASLRQRFPVERLVDETLTAKLRRRGGPAHRSQTVEAVTRSLRSFLESRIAPPFEISDVRSLAGGSSKEQFAFVLTYVGDQGEQRQEHLTLRMRPTAGIVETHALREYQALQAVSGHLPVPEVKWIDPDGAEFGQPAMIYAFCKGITRPPREGAHTPRQGFGPKYRALLAPQFVRYFAELGKFDWRNADMSAFDVPEAGSNAGVIALINWWERVWEEDNIEPNPLMTLTAQWLRENAPPIDFVSLVHQDFRGGNFLFDDETGEITAFLDWELALLGDRHADLAYFMSPSFSEKLENGDVLVGGLIGREAFIEQYERLSGLPVSTERLEYYEIYTCWRAAINCVATAPRVMMGEQTHQDIRVGWIMGNGPLMLDTLCETISKKLQN
jgi:aminoglycoside phosphotransferase (APT) family kinase protein